MVPSMHRANYFLPIPPPPHNFAPLKTIHMTMRQIAFREALREAMQEEMRRDERVFLMGEEVAEYNGAYKVSQGMLDEFGPKRVIDTPISELGFAAVAVGAAQNGLRPIVEFMTWNFAVLPLDQILNTASKMLAMSGGQVGCPIVFRGPNGSAGQLGAQHSTAFESMYANIPGLKVISVSNPYDAKGLLKSAIRDDDPVIFMESEVMYGEKGEVPEEEYLIPIGKADVKRPGRDVTIVSFNKMMKVALGAATELEKEGINAEVIDLRTIRPLDWMTILESVKKTNRLVIVEEQWPYASISSEISYRIQKEAFDYLDAPIRRITAADAPMHYAPNLVAGYLPDVPRTVKLVKEVMYLKK
jgi:pyruvate dehydrogenase E1 component beta subunit